MKQIVPLSEDQILDINRMVPPRDPSREAFVDMVKKLIDRKIQRLEKQILEIDSVVSRGEERPE